MGFKGYNSSRPRFAIKARGKELSGQATRNQLTDLRLRLRPSSVATMFDAGSCSLLQKEVRSGLNLGLA